MRIKGGFEFKQAFYIVLFARPQIYKEFFELFHCFLLALEKFEHFALIAVCTLVRGRISFAVLGGVALLVGVLFGGGGHLFFLLRGGLVFGANPLALGGEGKSADFIEIGVDLLLAGPKVQEVGLGLEIDSCVYFLLFIKFEEQRKGVLEAAFHGFLLSGDLGLAFLQVLQGDGWWEENGSLGLQVLGIEEKAELEIVLSELDFLPRAVQLFKQMSVVVLRHFFIILLKKFLFLWVLSVRNNFKDLHFKVYNL